MYDSLKITSMSKVESNVLQTLLILSLLKILIFEL